jgi:copper oxidase (laccase) domain-containing protein
MKSMPKNIVCEISEAQDGNMDFRFGGRNEVLENRTLFLERFGIAYQEHIAMRCDHGDIITLVDAKNEAIGATSQEEQTQSEVLVTQKKHLALMLFTADCQPVSFYDPVTQTIALAHISRKTLTAKLPEKTVRFLKQKLTVDPANLLVNIGPSIQKESYAFPLPLTEVNPLLAPFIEEKGGFAYIDLVGANLEQLTAAGVKKENITVSTDDTASPEYFSYFMMKKNNASQEARMATILLMR